MARDIVDERLIGALHVRAMGAAAFADEHGGEHAVFQAGTLAALMAGRFEGDATIGSILAKGDQGIGTVERLDGEMVIVDGEAHVVDADGRVRRVPDGTTTPFAVVCRFRPTIEAELPSAVGLGALHALLEAAMPTDVGVLAVRLDGTFRDLRLRSVRGQHPPYPPLTEVTRHQTEWTLGLACGTVVGFRFPDSVAGVEVPGFHLHFLSDDRSSAGHVLDLMMAEGRFAIDGGDELHVELPADIGLGTPGVADRAAIRSAEGGTA